MERELQRILSGLKEKTGIEIDVVSENGLIYATTKNEYVSVDEKNFTDILQKNNRTYFKFDFNNTKFIGAINGDGKIEKNYAVFIICFIESNENKEADLSFESQFLAIITGEATKTQYKRFIEKYSVSKENCYIVIFESENGKAIELCDFLNNYSINGYDNALVCGDNSVIYVKFIDNEADAEYQSTGETVDLIINAFYEETGLKCGAYIGSKVKSFADINISYSQALSCKRLKEFFEMKDGVYAYKDFIIVKILEDLPTAKNMEYFNSLAGINAKDVLKDEELISTAEEFLRNDLNISETARVLYIHRNTLMYRLDKLEKMTGLNIRKFNDALTFRVVITLAALLKN